MMKLLLCTLFFCVFVSIQASEISWTYNGANVICNDRKPAFALINDHLFVGCGEYLGKFQVNSSTLVWTKKFAGFSMGARMFAASDGSILVVHVSPTSNSNYPTPTNATRFDTDGHLLGWQFNAALTGVYRYNAAAFCSPGYQYPMHLVDDQVAGLWYNNTAGERRCATVNAKTLAESVAPFVLPRVSGHTYLAASKDASGNWYVLQDKTSSQFVLYKRGPSGTIAWETKLLDTQQGTSSKVKAFDILIQGSSVYVVAVRKDSMVLKQVATGDGSVTLTKETSDTGITYGESSAVWFVVKNNAVFVQAYYIQSSKNYWVLLDSSLSIKYDAAAQSQIPMTSATTVGQFVPSLSGTKVFVDTWTAGGLSDGKDTSSDASRTVYSDMMCMAVAFLAVLFQ